MTNATAADPRVAAIVPAYNEGETLAAVLTVLKSVPLIHEVLVVSDGSTDDTVAIARSMGLRTIHLRTNHGKGKAMAVGVDHTDAPVLVFVDGDILNLTASMLSQLIEPVLSGGSDMNVGIRHRGELVDAIHRRVGPLLSGIRCLRREVFAAVPESHIEGFAIETGLNWACRQIGGRITTTVLHGLKHLVKEKKRGLARGMYARFEMFGVVFAAWLDLQVKRPDPRSAAVPNPTVRPAVQAAVQPELEYINF
jgi:glycosyltransferase involved in cell wall biosynthesis